MNTAAASPLTDHQARELVKLVQELGGLAVEAHQELLAGRRATAEAVLKGIHERALSRLLELQLPTGERLGG